jgi:hypothetical protein
MRIVLLKDAGFLFWYSIPAQRFSSSFSIRRSMLDVRCSMFINFFFDRTDGWTGLPNLPTLNPEPKTQNR